jgi:ribA/ribD-fused uncharacterized protein
VVDRPQRPDRPGGPIQRFEGEHDFLSNFYESPVVLKGRLFPTAEHAYQAAKTLDPEEQASIQAARTPGLAKRIGRKAPLRPDWEQVKVRVMAAVLEAKFYPGSELAERLLLTGGRHLMEGNTWGDTFWGCELVAGNLWVGANTLGMLLMERREALRAA